MTHTRQASPAHQSAPTGRACCEVLGIWTPGGRCREVRPHSALRAMLDTWVADRARRAPDVRRIQTLAERFGFRILLGSSSQAYMT